MMSTSTEESVAPAKTFGNPVRLHTFREASELLEGLRAAYQSLAPRARRQTKMFMAERVERQRRFGN
jgi:hypothetical protein